MQEYATWVYWILQMTSIFVKKKWECFTKHAKGGHTKRTGDQQNGGFSWSLICRNWKVDSVPYKKGIIIIIEIAAFNQTIFHGLFSQMFWSVRPDGEHG